ncbi:hypothetical protein BOTBODRAFT_177757 [Botryobasidium botryosum FD-172 SS1]|uniref:Uncharacterized protein n=1 Tax=Botryobasidium botryosum (strain FD-172 SS1) TaxID=930990 RepID=A0A067MH52_BOTB1|nr:hypothetical protein BOTBODRAFT_177757 [Botryobasidium botryosum FD-172 SS1]
MPTTHDALKEHRPVGSYPSKEFWEGNLPSKLIAPLDSMGVKWTSLDTIRIRTAFHAPVVLWISSRSASRRICDFDHMDDDHGANKAIDEFIALHQEISAYWATPESRTLGSIPASLFISAGVGSISRSEDCTKGRAVAEIDGSEVDVGGFNGDAIDLGARVEASSRGERPW